METIQYITNASGMQTGLFINFQHPQTPPVLKNKLTNLQLELLKLYSKNIPSNDLSEIKQLIAQYFAEKMTIEADKIWEEKQYKEEDLLNLHLRTEYKTNK